MRVPGAGRRPASRPTSRPRPVGPARAGKVARPAMRTARVAGVKHPPKSRPRAVRPAVTAKMQRLSRRLTAPRPASRPPAKLERIAPRTGGDSGDRSSYRYFDGHPVNYSPPWMEGTRSVGSTLTLHVGGWWNAETYWIYLWQWTPAYGWQQVGWYDLGWATSMQLYLGWEWAYSYIGFEVQAWNSNPWHGWSDLAWSGGEYVYPYWGRPYNTSPPWVEGWPAVGNTVQLHVGSWAEAEQYAIDLYRYTHAAGWTYLGNYQLGGATSMSLYLGTDWADAYIGYYAHAWNPPHGWSDAAWSGMHWVDPRRPANVSAPYVSGTPQVGNTVSLNVGQWRHTEQYAIDLYRYTASAGWTFIGNYYLGGATSMSLYLGTDWADAHIGFYAWGWNGIWGWSTYAWSGSYWVDPVRPTNLSAPYVAGNREVGSTVTLHVGQWRHTEQYAIDLYRYTASAGWTFIGNYYLGGATSMSLYLGWEWADAQIGFYAWGWNGIWGWSTNAWSGSHYVDPLSVRVSLPSLAVTTYDPAVTSSPMHWGATVTTTVSNSSDKETYRWRFRLTPGDRLQALSDGSVAVVRDAQDDGEDVPEDDYSDGGVEDPADVDPVTEEPEDPEGLEDEVEDTEDYDPVDEEDPNDGLESETALGAIDAAQAEVDGDVIAVITVGARGTSGESVPAYFSVSGDVATMIVSHRSGSYGYPVTVSSEAVEDASEIEDASGEGAFGMRATSETAASCSNRSKIVTYNPHGWAQLLNAFKQYPTPCADYYIVIPPDPSDRPLKRTVRPRAVWQDVCDANAAVSSVGARVYPVAEFHYGGWRNWVLSPPGQPPTGRSTQARWRVAGRIHRKRMRDAGYGSYHCPSLGAVIPERWAINEFGTTFTSRTRQNPNIDPALVRANARNASLGLFYGYDGPGTTNRTDRPKYPDMRGIPFVIGSNHDKTGFSVYKPGLRRVVLDSGFWNAMKKYVLFWGQQAYTSCYRACVASANRARRAKHVNAFTMHPVKFAYLAQKGTTTEKNRSAAARSFFAGRVPRYMPLLTGYWAKIAPKQSPAYGRTHSLTLEEMKGLVSLEIYSTRRHASGASGSAADTSTAFGRYPHRRIAIAWHEEPEFVNGVPNPEYDQNQEVANRIALAIRAAYQPGGTAAAACAPEWCSVNVPDRSPPVSERPRINLCWLKNFDPHEGVWRTESGTSFRC
jgi:hypothetical protein